MMHALRQAGPEEDPVVGIRVCAYGARSDASVRCSSGDAFVKWSRRSRRARRGYCEETSRIARAEVRCGQGDA
jgi:hypothetical protein